MAGIDPDPAAACLAGIPEIEDAGLIAEDRMQCGLPAARCFTRAAALLCLFSAVLAQPARAQSTVVLNGASQYGENHAVTRTLTRFEDLIKQYYGKPIDIVLHRNGSRGLEKQYFAFMGQGATVDYAIVSLVHMAERSKTARLLEAPFLFRDVEHWRAALGANLLKPFADEIAQKADVMLIGFAGGGVRNIFASKPVANLSDLKSLKIRVPGAPLWRETFEAAGMAPAAIIPNEVFGAIRKGTFAGTEGDAAWIEAARLHEVAPYLVTTGHAIAIRPLCFSAKVFKTLPADLQSAILRAGAEAAAYGRELELAEENARLAALEQAGKLKRVAFEDRAQLKALADPVLAAYAKEIGADGLLAAIGAK
jgi:TRAP-type C4-dicarboxylate transport system substrate-binding protein